jgi:hypothetical protein
VKGNNMLIQDRRLKYGYKHIPAMLALKGFKTIEQAEKSGYDIIYNEILFKVYNFRKRKIKA